MVDQQDHVRVQKVNPKAIIRFTLLPQSEISIMYDHHTKPTLCVALIAQCRGAKLLVLNGERGQCYK